MLAYAMPKLLPSGTIRASRGLPTVVLTRGLFAGGFFGAEWFIPLMLVRERGLSSVLAGGALAGAAVGWFIGSWLQGRPTVTITRDRLVVIGAVFTTLGMAASSLVALDAFPWQLIVVTWAIGAFGMGMLYGSLGVSGAEAVAYQRSRASTLPLCRSLTRSASSSRPVSVASSSRPPTCRREQDAGVYLTIFLTMTAIAVVGRSSRPGRPHSAGVASSSIALSDPAVLATLQRRIATFQTWAVRRR